MTKGRDEIETTIEYRLSADGGFAARNLATGQAAYAYPTSNWSDVAKRSKNLASTAAKFLTFDHNDYRTRLPDYWARVGQHIAGSV